MDSLIENGGLDFDYLFSPIQTTNYLIIIVAFLLIIGLIYCLAHHLPKTLKGLGQIKNRILGYKDLVSLVLRVGLGVIFIGAAINNVFIIPSIPYFPTVGGLELILGTLLLLGLFVTPAVLAVIGFFITGMIHSGFIIGNLEILGSAVAILMIGNDRPGLDDLLGIPTLFRDKWEKYSPLILRISLGSAFIFLAFYQVVFNPHYLSSVIEKYNLIYYLPVSTAMWTLLIGLLEIVFGILILVGYKTRLTSFFAFLIVIFTYRVFKEDLYSHASIFAVLLSLFVTGGGHWSLDEHLETPTRLPSKKRAPRKIAGKKKSVKKKITAK